MKQQEKLYSQTEIANLTGLSKATVSRYLRKNHVPETIENNAKLYPEKVLKQIQKEQKPHKSKQNQHPSTIQLLLEQISQLKEENSTLKEQLKIKDEQIKTLSTLTSQAQQLNALDKKTKEIEEPKQTETKKHWWQR